MDKRKAIIDGALSLTVSALVVKILGVIYKVPLSYMLGDSGMGYFNTAYGIYGMFYILSSSGIPKATTCIIGVFFTVLLLLASPLLVRILSNSGALLPLVAIAPSLLFVTVSGVCRGYLSARGRLMPIAVSQILEALLKLALGIGFARLGTLVKADLTTVSALAVLGITVGAAIGSVYLILCANKINKQYKARQKIYLENASLYKRVLKTVLPITLGALIMTFGGLLDIWLIMNSTEHLGITNDTANELYGNYSTLAIPMFNLALSLVTPLTVALLPRLISSRLKGAVTEFKKQLESCILYTVFFVAPCAAVFYFYSFDILDIIFSSWQSARGYSMLSALTLGLVFLSLLNILNTAHEALGNFLPTVSSLAATTLSKLVLSSILIRSTSLGILAIPVSTALSYFVGVIISYLWLVRSGMKISLTKAAALPILFAIISFAVPFKYLFSSGFLAGGFIQLILVLLISGALYVVLCAACFLAVRVKNVNMNKKTCR